MTVEERVRELLKDIPDTCQCGSCVRYTREALMKFARDTRTRARAEMREEAARVAEELYACHVVDESGGQCWMYEDNIAAEIRKLEA